MAKKATDMGAVTLPSRTTTFQPVPPCPRMPILKSCRTIFNAQPYHLTCSNATKITNTPSNIRKANISWRKVGITRQKSAMLLLYSTETMKNNLLPKCTRRVLVQKTLWHNQVKSQPEKVTFAYRMLRCFWLLPMSVCLSSCCLMAAFTAFIITKKFSSGRQHGKSQVHFANHSICSFASILLVVCFRCGLMCKYQLWYTIVNVDVQAATSFDGASTANVKLMPTVY